MRGSCAVLCRACGVAMGPAADFAALGTQAECILQRAEQAQAADRPRAWEGPAGQARDDQEEGGGARGAEADQGVWMTARVRAARRALHVSCRV